LAIHDGMNVCTVIRAEQGKQVTAKSVDALVAALSRGLGRTVTISELVIRVRLDWRRQKGRIL